MVQIEALQQGLLVAEDASAVGGSAVRKLRLAFLNAKFIHTSLSRTEVNLEKFSSVEFN